MQRVRCAAGVLDKVVAHARRDAPRECCGVLIGREDQVVDAVATRNLAASDNRFELDPQGHFAARRSARDAGLSVVGFYHSHPQSAPEPSAADASEASYPGHLYAIVSLLGDGEVRMFRWSGRAFDEVAL